MRRFFKTILYISITLCLLGGAATVGIYLHLEPKLPSINRLQDVQFQVPLRVFSEKEELIAEFGEMRRTPHTYQQFPKLLRQAIIASEDANFYQHPGVDIMGLMRAVYILVTTGEKGAGGSTITMQVARNFFLSREKTFLRKFNEILLALKIDRELSKEDILELYLNKIYLGKRAYGAAAASHVYYGGPLSERSLAELAMIAGLPKAPSTYNPINNPDRALLRRNYVLGRMRALNMIDEPQYRKAVSAEITAKQHQIEPEIDAIYVAEMVRAEMVSRFGEAAYVDGYKVYVTIDKNLQHAANKAVKDGLLAYDRRHGYRGATAHIDIEAYSNLEKQLEFIGTLSKVGPLEPALVTTLREQEADLLLANGELITLPWEGMAWARPYITDRKRGKEPITSSDILTPGDLIYIESNTTGVHLAQIPLASSSLVSLDPEDGAILALSGGFDFYHSKFNRVTQAIRQPGSNLKPFIYSAGLEQGMSTATLINDAPIVFNDANLEGEWRPENYSGKFFGPTRLRQALIKSRNLVSIRLLRKIGVPTALEHLERFGFNPDEMPHNLSLSLGSANLTPLDLVTKYAMLANNGYQVESFFISHIINGHTGETILEHRPRLRCLECRNDSRLPILQAKTTTPTEQHQLSPPTPLPAFPNLAPQTVSEENIYLINSMLKDVIQRGTGRKARSLGRKDIGGKTGTTNDQRDAWFSGYNDQIVATAWVGFDTPRSLGRKETGGRAALPIWIDYMKVALENRDISPQYIPSGIVSVRIDSKTGEYAEAGNKNAIFELFRRDNAPKPTPVKTVEMMRENLSEPPKIGSSVRITPPTGEQENITEDLF